MRAAEMENTNHQQNNTSPRKNTTPKAKYIENLMMCALPECMLTKFKAGNIEIKYVSAHSNHTTGPNKNAFYYFLPVHRGNCNET